AFVCESSGKINDLVTCRMAAHILNGLSARSFRQHSYFTADVTVVDLLLNAMLQAFQLEKSSAFFMLANIITQSGCRSTRPLGIFEDIQRVITDLLNQTHRVAKIRPRLAGEADNNITSNSNSASRFFDCFYSSQIITRGM